MNLLQFFGALELGLIYSLVAMGVYLSFRVLQFPDLTVDGSFPLGAAVCATMVIHGFSPVISIGCSILAGGIAGLITAFLSTRMKVLNLLAGILTMTALYSVNLRIMGRPNIPLLGERNFFLEYFNGLQNIMPLCWRVIPLFLVVLIFAILLNLFLKTNLGLAVRAIGSNARMGRANGINDHIMIGIGLLISNGLVAAGGAFFTQVNFMSDVTLGNGTIVVGLAAVIIGETICLTRNIWLAITSCVIGAILYRLLIAMALNVGGIGLNASDLNLITAVLVAIAMFLPNIKQKVKMKNIIDPVHD